MTTAVPTKAMADFAPTQLAEGGSQPGGAVGMDFASVLSGLAENSGGKGAAEPTTPDAPEVKSAEEPAPTETVPDALTLASLAQLWLPPTPKPLPEPLSTTSAVSSDCHSVEAGGQPAGLEMRNLPAPGDAALAVGHQNASSAEARNSVRGDSSLVASLSQNEGQGDGAPPTISTALIANVAGLENAAGQNSPMLATAPLRTSALRGPVGIEEPAVSRTWPGAPGATVTTTTISPEQVFSEIPTAPTPPPLARRFASAAEIMFTTLTDAVDPAAVDTRVPGAGTGTAKQGDTMKRGSDQKQFAESGEQALPLELASAPAVPRGGARVPTEVRGLADLHVNETPMFSSLLPLSSAGYFGVEDLRDVPALGAVTARPVVELTQAGLMQHVTELRYSGATEMAVVLKPDADTQLALRLTFNSQGEVAVQARCEQGDGQMLAASWGEIRHSLAQQGVRLGALEFAADHRATETLHPQAGNGGPSPDGQPSSQRHGQPWPETLDDLPLAGSLTEPPGRRGVQRGPANLNRLLESWA